MTETKIKGLKVLLDDDYIEIVDAHQINNKEKMKEFITEACDRMDFCNMKRTMNSMVRQWAFTNRMYRWHILKKKHSKCIITNKINWFKTVIYFLLGFQQIRFAKIKKRLEKRKMSDVTLGTLYDVNKNLVLNGEIKLTEGVINSKKEINNLDLLIKSITESNAEILNFKFKEITLDTVFLTLTGRSLIG